ncbi:hypothetical protein DV451_004893 [Geotrichum candidum]|uniref:VPS10 domain-containing protein n=1 Tax=Geotrichum candidum TaxID=1173061 RepID=A0A9P5KRW6_GEOCN|nr:hypothetical protein DV451_004893 [Geotrichum candidum]
MAGNQALILLYLENTADKAKLFRSTDDGESWNEVKVSSSEGNFISIISHPHNFERAYILTDSKVHFATNDRGKSWYPIEFPVLPVPNGPPFAFHATNPDYVLFAGIECSGEDYLQFKCVPQYFYTTDNFKNKREKFVQAHQCAFTHSTKAFNQGDDRTVICSVNSDSDSNDSSIKNRRLASSSNWFKNKEILQLDGNDITSVTGIAITSKFIVATTKLQDSEAITLVVSTDGEIWDEAIFPQEPRGFTEYEITILESSEHSLHIDILKENTQISGDFYVSNSNGTYFTKTLSHTNRNAQGYVDIEKVQNVEGILIANIVDNWKQVRESKADKKIRTQISYDDGRTWSFLNIADTDCNGDLSCGLNVHSVLDKSNVGRIFSSPALGILAAVGNPGTELKDYEDGDLYVSHNSGLTWKRSRQDAHKYEFGDSGNLFVSVYDEGASNSIYYSLDKGSSWDKVDLGLKMRPKYLFTTPDSTDMKFILIAKANDNKDQTILITVDFTGIFTRQCVLKDDNSGDLEKWYARWADQSNPSCQMGRKQYFYRKKPGKDCYVGNVYNEQLPTYESCQCAEEDYECDYNFIKVPDGSCVATNVFQEDTGDCKSGGSGYMGRSGYRKIPGNSCLTDKGGLVLDGLVKKTCDGKVDGANPERKPNPDDSKKNNGNKEEEKKPGTPKQIKKTLNEFKGRIIDYFYLKSDDPSQVDETLILRTEALQVYISHDHGANWEQILDNKEVVAIYANPYFPNHVYLITTKEEVAYSTDRGQTWKTFRTPSLRNSRGSPYISFNKNKPGSFIWMGELGCEDHFSSTCRTSAFYTSTYGDRWNDLQENVQRCTYSNDLKTAGEDFIYCEKFYLGEGGATKSKLIYSNDFFKTHETAFTDILGFALENEFVVVATINVDDSLTAHVSVDGTTFATVNFPPNFRIAKQQAYTILESITNSIFIHVTTNSQADTAFGSILKSNSNGTNYVDSVDYVNRNAAGYVDFEKVIGLEGVAIVNVVTNPDQAVQGSKKILKSKITHNDGGEWAYITPPEKDSEGKKYNCPGTSLNRCSLNLHGFTERADYRDTFSSQSAVGMMLAVGNVGESLSPLFDSNTFFTKDGGVTWKEIRKGYYMWEYGDQGSIIVVVNGQDNTNIVSYSLDEGETWNDYQFSDDLIKVEDIATVPSDTSRKFLLFARSQMNRGDRSYTIQIDFTDMFDRKCVLNEQDPENDDFELWTPSHPFQEENCFFGHESQYYRKVKGQDCYIGRSLMEPHTIIRNCSCTRQDFECDINYIRGNDGACHLVDGYTPPDHSLICKEMPGTVEYWVPTGYRRIPLSTCEGGLELERTVPVPCPGKENEFKQKHRGLHGFGLFFVIVLPIGMSGVIGYILYDHYSKRYGQIRLGEENDTQPVAIQYLIVAVAGIVALASVIPSFFSSIYRRIQNKLRNRNGFTTRSSFSRGSYSEVAAEDENELLAEGLDESDEDDSDGVRV